MEERMQVWHRGEVTMLDGAAGSGGNGTMWRRRAPPGGEGLPEATTGHEHGPQWGQVSKDDQGKEG